MATKHTDSIITHDLPSGEGLKIGIVVSRWNTEITGSLLEACRQTLISNGVAEDDLVVEYVPGSFELPLGARLLAAGKKLDAIICLGCIIKGETKHDEYIAQSVANGLMQLGLMSSMPVIFGVLTPNTEQQAIDRAGGTLGNKGEEAAAAALEMVALKKTHGQTTQKIGFS